MRIKQTVPEELQQKLCTLLPELVLASGSPNRRLLLEECGVKVIVKSQDIDEICGLVNPPDVVKVLSREKLESYLSSDDFIPALPAIGIDTLVELDGELLGKPASREDAERMLSSFSGRTQLVWSGLSLYIPGHDVITEAVSSEVGFRTLTAEEIEAYLDTDEYIGAAGGYRIQKTGYTLVERIEGSWSNVIGLPLEILVKDFEALRSAPGQV